MARSGISRDLFERVLQRFGLAAVPSADLQGLNALYGGWCANVPFDNTRKMVALRTGGHGPLPGIDPVDFLDAWLDHGTGGTCWPSCNALFALLERCGFDAERTTASMMDLSTPNHSTILVRLDGDDYFVDSSMLLNRALRLTRDRRVLDPDPLKPIEYETVDGAIRLWFEFPRLPGHPYLPCRLMERGVTRSAFQEAYEVSRTVSPFNTQLYATRNFPDRIEVFHGRTQVTRDRSGSFATREHDGDTLRLALTDTVGLSPSFVEAWVRSGALEDSLAQHPVPDLPPVSDVQPSKR